MSFKKLRRPFGGGLRNSTRASPLAQWARGVAANKILHAIRHQKRVPVAMEPESIEAILSAFERIASQSNDRKDALAECLERLSDRSRNLLAMKYEQDLRAEEIGRRIQQETNAVHQSLSRIRAKLADCIRGRLELAGGRA